MQNVRVLAALGMLGFVGAANAEISASVTATNDYVFRGITQTSEDPALQASIDYANESGWYIGAWGSNVDFGPGDPANIEVDFYTGFAGETEAGLGWDVGLTYYTYPDESDYNYPEIYGLLSYGIFSGGLYYSNDWLNLGNDAMYVSAGVSVPFANGFSFNASVGYSFGDGFENIDVSEEQDGSDLRDTEYLDYSIGVGYTLGNFDLSLAWIDTDLDRRDPLFSSTSVGNSEGRVVLTVATSFPWGSD